MASNWFCKISGREVGPLTAQQLVDMARQGQLGVTDAVRKEDSAWVPASKVKGLFTEKTGSTVLPDATEAWEKAKSASETESPGETASPRGSGEGGDGGDQMMSGSTLGNYRVLETLGEGGMGVVLKAQHIRMDRMVALKVLRSTAMGSPLAVKRFQQEVRAAAKLVHPNIVTAYDADEVRGVHFLVMEYVDGRSLADVICERGYLSLRDALEYTIQVARGLAYAHSEGIVHRDIKPGNLLLDKRGTVKILDMGLASILETTSTESKKGNEFVTQEHQLLGTFDYMPPEQAEDARSVDHRADIYSLGCTMYRFLTGKAPYKADSILKKIFAHRESPIPSLMEKRPDVTKELDQVFAKMVAKKAQERFQSMDDVIARLDAILSGRSRPVSGSDMLGHFPGNVTVSGESPRAPSIQISADSNVYVPAPTDDGGDDFVLLAPEAGGNRYYWQVMGHITGPFTLAQLRKKKISPDDMVRTEGSTEWSRASEVQGLW